MLIEYRSIIFFEMTHMIHQPIRIETSVLTLSKDKSTCLSMQRSFILDIVSYSNLLRTWNTVLVASFK